MVQFPPPASTGVAWVELGSPEARTTPLGEMVLDPAFVTFTVNVTVTELPMEGLTVVALEGLVKAAVIGEGEAVTVRDRVAGTEERLAEFLAVTASVGAPLARKVCVQVPVAFPATRRLGVTWRVPSPKSHANSTMDPPTFGSVAVAVKV
jgi:hypothetical protein